MLDSGFISHGELLAARRDAPRVISQSLYYSPDYFLDYAYAETLALIESQGLQSDYVIEVKSTAELRTAAGSPADRQRRDRHRGARPIAPSRPPW